MLTRLFLIGIIIGLIFSTQPVNAQGLKGQATGIRDLSQPPPLLSGKSDNERWNLFLNQQRQLIGMGKEQVIKIFGPGADYRIKDKLHYKLTDDNLPSKKGSLAYLELTITFKNKLANSYSVTAVYWG